MLAGKRLEQHDRHFRHVPAWGTPSCATPQPRRAERRRDVSDRVPPRPRHLATVWINLIRSIATMTPPFPAPERTARLPQGPAARSQPPHLHLSKGLKPLRRCLPSPRKRMELRQIRLWRLLWIFRTLEDFAPFRRLSKRTGWRCKRVRDRHAGEVCRLQRA